MKSGNGDTDAHQKLGCRVCGKSPTVHSHLIPRALAFEIRGDEPNLTVLERGAERPLALQAGLFDDMLLCAEHEQITGELDRYGVEFIRRVRSERGNSNGQGITVPNPDPAKLARFVHSIVWRAVSSRVGNQSNDALGSRYTEITNSVFSAKPSETVLFCGSVRFENDSKEIITATMPQRTRQDGRWLWQFQLNGTYFTLFIGGKAFPQSFASSRADLHDPVYIPCLPTTDALDWEGMKSVILSIKRHPRIA